MNIDDLLYFSMEEDLLALKRRPTIKDDIIYLLPEDDNSPFQGCPQASTAKEELMAYLDCLDFPINDSTHEPFGRESDNGFSIPKTSNVDKF